MAINYATNVHSNKFLIGTTEAAHRVVPFLNFTWDGWNVKLSYDKNQIVPSPLGMRLYESILFSSGSLGTDLFVNHQSPMRHAFWALGSMPIMTKQLRLDGIS